MSDQGRVYSSFVTSFTRQGFYSLAQEALCSTDHVFVLRGGGSRAKTAVVARLSEAVAQRGRDVELLRSSRDSAFLEGLVVPAWRMAVVDGPSCQVNAAQGRGLSVDLEAYCDGARLSALRPELEAAEAEIEDHLAQAAVFFGQAKEVHNQVEAHYVRGLDFARADAKAEALMAEIFGSGAGGAKPQVRSLFAVAWLPDTGAMADFRMQSTDDCCRRYILKGRPGTGKSFLSKKIARAAHAQGYDTLLYICNFDLNSLDGVVIPALSTALLDGTPTHTLEPQRSGDEIVDMLECVDLARVDQEAIQVLQSGKQARTAESQRHLIAAHRARERLESLYAQMVDEAAIGQVVRVMREQIALIAF